VSKRRPQDRDRLEGELLELVKRRAEEIARYDELIALKQAAIDRIEGTTTSHQPVFSECSGADMDHENPCFVANTHVNEDPGTIMDENESAGGEIAEVREAGDDNRLKALRAVALLTGMCHRVIKSDHPKLVVRVIMLAADLPGAISGRQVAKIYGLSAERISQQLEEFQRRFNLPPNRHNKSLAAVNTYRENAGLINEPKIA
jgi:hypothetical protein